MINDVSHLSLFSAVLCCLNLFFLLIYEKLENYTDNNYSLFDTCGHGLKKTLTLSQKFSFVNIQIRLVIRKIDQISKQSLLLMNSF